MNRMLVCVMGLMVSICQADNTEESASGVITQKGKSISFNSVQIVKGSNSNGLPAAPYIVVGTIQCHTISVNNGTFDCAPKQPIAYVFRGIPDSHRDTEAKVGGVYYQGGRGLLHLMDVDLSLQDTEIAGLLGVSFETLGECSKYMVLEEGMGWEDRGVSWYEPSKGWGCIAEERARKE